MSLRACKLDGDGTSELLRFTFRFMKFSESTRWPLGSSVRTTTFFKDEKSVLWQSVWVLKLIC